ncbi:phage tail protein [uncultured Pseudosulfitobacter sp.]|uniref:phage tail protein n=1 Tax=uncultured Pseudosulfitobacter sp. TaxID=2854214 RepID=UPI0030DD2587|tara:strand:- start:18380 stop:20446 length:2067 start_codon:yes stop_codon:yes gene_type:complete
MAIFSSIAFGIAFAGGYLAAAVGFSIATATSIGVALANAVVSLALSAISRALQPSVSVPQSEIQAVISQASAPRRIYVGENLAGGVRALFEVKDGTLYQLIMVAHGEITSFDECWIDGEPVTLDVDGDVNAGKMKTYVNIQTRDGSAFGGDYADLFAEFHTWNAARKLEAQATFLAQMKAPHGNDFSKVFPKSYNTALQWVIRGQEIYDPRDLSTGYADNAALVMAHFLSHEDGFKIAPEDINWDSVAAMADVADEAVPQLEGGTAARLRLWGYWTLDEPPSDVLDRMHASSGIRAYEMQDGCIGLIGGSFGTPACTITAKDIREIQTSEAISERDGYNVLRVLHMDANQKYTVTEVDAWRDEDRLAIEGEIVQEYELSMCPNRSQARRLAKEQLHDGNRAKVSIITNLVGLKARFPREDGQRHTILLDYQPEDGSGRVIQGEYEVLDHEFDPIELQCRIDLAAVDRASGEWTPEEAGDPPTELPISTPTEPPEISAVFTQRILQASAANPVAILEVEAVEVPGRNDITVEARYWRFLPLVKTDMQTSGYIARSGPVEDGQTYFAEARFNGVFDAPDEWVSLGSVTVQINGTAPGAVTELFASNGTDRVNLNWRNPSSDFHELRIYRSTTAVFGDASLIGTTGGVAGQISEFSDETVTAATEYNYWVAAANVSGVEGSPTGPANITTT